VKDTPQMQDLDTLFTALQQSRFRSRFRLQGKEREYLRTKGIALVVSHASEFIEKRLAPAFPAKDGKQTPWRGHPVFLAQHATATCCRGCLEKWHGIQRGRVLSQNEQHYVVIVIERWLREQKEEPDCIQNSHIQI
jgi:hypothetical protein